MSYLWSFGTGDDSQSETPTYNYTEPGSYDVTLTVTNESRCFDTYKETAFINVYEIPVSDFTLDPEELPTLNPSESKEVTPPVLVFSAVVVSDNK